MIVWRDSPQRPAEIETQANLDRHATRVAWWLLHSTSNRITIESPMVDPTHAIVCGRDSGTWGPGRSVVMVLNRNPAMPDGYSIFTSFANP